VPSLSASVAIALAVGLALGVSSDARLNFILTIVLAGAWAIALVTYRHGHARTFLAAVHVLVAGAGVVLGVHAVDAAEMPPLRRLLERSGDDEPIVVEGRLREDAFAGSSGIVLPLDVERVLVAGAFISAPGGVSISVVGEPSTSRVMEWSAGRVVRVPATLRRPARYLNDGLENQERAMARRGVCLVGSVKSAQLVEVLAAGWWWEETAAAIRGRTRQALARHLGRDALPSSVLGTAILLGDRAGLSADLERRLQEAGTYHVIAISGGNIAILAGLVLGALAVAGIRGPVACSIGIVVLATYCLVAASGASVWRATLMAVLYLAVRLIDHRTSAVNALSLTAAIILLTHPLAIVDVGLWLTFGATAALMTGASLLWMHPRGNALSIGTPAGRTIRAIALVLVATMCVELVLAPVGAYVFQRVTVAGLLLNLIAIPAMTLVQLASMALVTCDVLHLNRTATWFAQWVHIGTALLIGSTRLIDYVPWLTWRVPSPSAALLPVYYVSLVAAVASRRYWAASPWRVAPAIVAGSLLLWIVCAPAARIRAHGDGQLHLTLLDVGQGDAMLVTFPNGRTLLLDTGGVSPASEFDIGDRVIGPSLRARGLLSLDYLAVTHGDPDHIGGARAIVRDFAPREIWWGVPVANHLLTAQLRSDADASRLAWRTLQRGDRLDIGGVEVRTLHPPPPDWERQRVRNDDSLVFELRFGQVSLLLTGDIGRDVEAALLPTLDPLPVVVLKVPHHGSATSSSAAFLDRLRPRLALIGVGRQNHYGHPVSAVLGRLHDAGAEILRTDLHGQIDVVTDGATLRVSTKSTKDTKDTKSTKDTKDTKDTRTFVYLSRD
jgi:competence protein ComEC